MITIIGILLIIAGILSTMIVYVPLNKARLSINYFGGQTREHHQGLSFKWPWYSLEGPTVDMTAGILVTPGKVFNINYEEFVKGGWAGTIPARTYETGGTDADGSKKAAIVHVQWLFPIRPLKGFLANWINNGPNTIALETMATVDINLSDRCARKTSEWIMGHKKILGKAAANIFGGETITREEEKWGAVVGDPKLYDVNYGPKSQAAIEELFEVEQFEKSMEMLKFLIPDPAQRKEAIFTQTQKMKVEKKTYGFESADILNVLENLIVTLSRRP